MSEEKQQFGNIPYHVDPMEEEASRLKRDGDERTQREILEELKRKAAEAKEYNKQRQQSIEESSEALRKEFSTIKLNGRNGLRATAERNEYSLTDDVVEGGEQLDRMLDNRKFGLHSDRIEAIRVRAAVNKTFWDLILAARFNKERVFACCIAVLKDEAKDGNVREKAEKAFGHIINIHKKYKSDSDQAMIEIQKVRQSWETYLKLPWDIREELLREQILNPIVSPITEYDL